MLPDIGPVVANTIVRHLTASIVTGYRLESTSNSGLDTVISRLAASHELFIDTTPNQDDALKLASKVLRLHNDGFRLGRNLPDTLATYYGDETELLLLDGFHLLDALRDQGHEGVVQAMTTCFVLSSRDHSETATPLISLDADGQLQCLIRSPRAVPVRPEDATLVNWWRDLFYALSADIAQTAVRAGTLVTVNNRTCLHGRLNRANQQRIFRRWWGWL